MVFRRNSGKCNERERFPASEALIYVSFITLIPSAILQGKGYCLWHFMFILVVKNHMFCFCCSKKKTKL